MKKIAVLSSGGLDSFIAYRFGVKFYGEDSVTPVFVKYGQPYYDKENEAVTSLFGDKLLRINADLACEKLDNVPTIQKQEIFGRNLLLAFYGALVAPNVWIASLETEINPFAVRDKSPEFNQLTSGLLSFILKNRQLKTTIESPFDSLSKTEVVTTGLKLGITPEEITKTVSCYDPKFHTCGMCSTCFKRWVALSNNGIQEKMEHDPATENEYGQKVISLMRKEANEDSWTSRFSKKRKIETHNALIRRGLQGIFDTTELV
jgi:7-cyano-7-deazaguanine synthase in queuosine biosynthesis